MQNNTPIPRGEYPRPQFFRDSWQTLNGTWSCAFDQNNSGKDKSWQNTKGFDQLINVPFAPESRLSGIGYTDFINAIWYHRQFTIPNQWQNKEILLHFGGVDYQCTIYIDGVEVGRHTGGSSPFTLNITRNVSTDRPHDLVVSVQDDIRSGIQPFGKQSPWLKSQMCNYTRTTGIWQSVWLEAVDKYALACCKIVPDADNGSLGFFPEFFNLKCGMNLSVNIFADGKLVAGKTIRAANGNAVVIEIPSPRLWDTRDPFLYDVEYIVSDENNNVLDRVDSYAGLRKIHLENGRFYLNNQPIFLRLVLDQGFYEDGIWTAPDDDAIQQDIKLALSAGFNGARLHQKVFDERFYYWADRLGYLTWAEFPSWGISFWENFQKCNPDYMRSFRDFYAEWSVLVKRDINHPSLITWTPFNETCNMYDLNEHRRIISDIYDLTRMLDPTRPINDTSGYTHVKTDLWTIHCYHQSAKDLEAALNQQPVYCSSPEKEAAYWNDQPLLVDEYGGIAFIPESRQPFADNSWGYNKDKLSQSEAEEKINSLTQTLVAHPRVCGYCYTQLTDIEQEQNGIYNYDRTPKFDMEYIRKCFSRKPEWSVL